MRIWLDDVRPMPDVYTHWAKTAHDACALLFGASMNGVEVMHISFDHDLAHEHYQNLSEFNPHGRPSKEWTGYDVALWIAEHNFWPTISCKVHSFNAPGARRICGVIDRYGPYDKKTIWEPAPMMGQALTREQCEGLVKQ